MPYPRARARPPRHDALVMAIVIFYAIGLPPKCLNILAESGFISFTVAGS
jgi:hypothetical protein